jgi:HSP20 family protein
MATFQQLKNDIGQAWEHLADGWENLTHKATNAITRFTNGSNKNQLSDEEHKEAANRSIGWGVMAAEVFDNDDKIIVRLEAPGLDIKELDIRVNEDVLTVAGEKKLQRERTEGYYHIKECAYGRFERAIMLPDEVDSDKAQADYKNGILRIELPKSANKRRKKIKVQVS